MICETELFANWYWVIGEGGDEKKKYLCDVSDVEAKVVARD